MDNSHREQGSNTQQDPKSFLVSLPIFENLIKWLASLIKGTGRKKSNREQVFILVTREVNEDRSNV